MSNSSFLKDVLNGLSQQPKRLSSKYFYDAKGDQLFQRIMELPEYYLTRAEEEILSSQTASIIDSFGFKTATNNSLIELGAGDGSKTQHLLRSLENLQYPVDYVAFDISPHVLKQLETKINTHLTQVQFKGIAGDYHDKLSLIKEMESPKVVLFLGSNLGNFDDNAAEEFILNIDQQLNPGDKLVLGLDRKKESSVVLPAYNDKEGITRLFNLNLLERINNELGANIDIESFEHAPHYDEKKGIAYSYLRSLKKQTVSIGQETFQFNKDEDILVEISRKYSHELVSQLIRNSRFQIKSHFQDEKAYFTDYLLEIH